MFGFQNYKKNIFLAFYIILNKKFYYKVIDLIELYNFAIKLVVI